MLEKLKEVEKEGLKKIKEASTESELETVRKELTGKKSTLSEVLKSLGKEDAETKKSVGMKANEIKNLFAEKITLREEEIVSNKSVLTEPIDLTLPGSKVESGSLHPITQMCYDLNDAFLSLGFEIYSEDDISSEKFAFDNFFEWCIQLSYYYYLVYLNNCYYFYFSLVYFLSCYLLYSLLILHFYKLYSFGCYSWHF